MAPSRFAYAALLVVLACNPALAAEPLQYDCDTAAGAFSELKQPVAGSSFQRVTGKVQVLSGRIDQRWLPAAAIRLDSTDGHSIAVQLSAEGRDKGDITANLVAWHKDDSQTQNLGRYDRSEIRSFSISPASAGVTVQFGKEKFDLPFNLATLASVSVTCSTGEFLFTDLVLGS